MTVIVDTDWLELPSPEAGMPIQRDILSAAIIKNRNGRSARILAAEKELSSALYRAAPLIAAQLLACAQNMHCHSVTFSRGTLPHEVFDWLLALRQACDGDIALAQQCALGMFGHRSIHWLTFLNEYLTQDARRMITVSVSLGGDPSFTFSWL